MGVVSGAASVVCSLARVNHARLEPAVVLGHGSRAVLACSERQVVGSGRRARPPSPRGSARRWRRSPAPGTAGTRPRSRDRRARRSDAPIGTLVGAAAEGERPNGLCAGRISNTARKRSRVVTSASDSAAASTDSMASPTPVARARAWPRQRVGGGQRRRGRHEDHLRRAGLADLVAAAAPTADGRSQSRWVSPRQKLSGANATGWGSHTTGGASAAASASTTWTRPAPPRSTSSAAPPPASGAPRIACARARQAARTRGRDGFRGRAQARISSR